MEPPLDMLNLDSKSSETKHISTAALHETLRHWKTPPKTNMEPKNDGFSKESPLLGLHFQVQNGSFRGCNWWHIFFESWSFCQRKGAGKVVAPFCFVGGSHLEWLKQLTPNSFSPSSWWMTPPPIPPQTKKQTFLEVEEFKSPCK